MFFVAVVVLERRNEGFDHGILLQLVRRSGSYGVLYSFVHQFLVHRVFDTDLEPD